MGGLKHYSLYVRGKRKMWCFDVWLDPRYQDEWRDDGLHLDEVLNVIPAWWVHYGLPVRLWCWLQDRGLVA